MDEYGKTMECNRCHEPVQKPFRFYRRAYHEECGILEASDAARQMANKSGPYYERWLETKGRYGRPRGVTTPFLTIDLYPDESPS